MYKNSIRISLIFRPLETVEENSCTELIQVNKRSRLQPEQRNNQGYNVQLHNLTLKYDISILFLYIVIYFHYFRMYLYVHLELEFKICCIHIFF
jgi:hypothetical protein